MKKTLLTLFLFAPVVSFGGIGIDESPFTIQLKTNVDAAGWRVALGVDVTGGIAINFGTGTSNTFTNAFFTKAPILNDVTAGRVAIFTGLKELTNSTITTAELLSLSSITGNVQDRLVLKLENIFGIGVSNTFTNVYLAGSVIADSDVVVTGAVSSVAGFLLPVTAAGVAWSSNIFLYRIGDILGGADIGLSLFVTNNLPGALQLGYPDTSGIVLDAFTNSLVVRNFDFTGLADIYARNFVSLGTAAGYIVIPDNDGSQSWIISVTNTVATNGAYLFPDAPRAGLWDHTLIDGTNVMATSFLTSTSPGWLSNRVQVLQGSNTVVTSGQTNGITYYTVHGTATNSSSASTVVWTNQTIYSDDFSGVFTNMVTQGRMTANVSGGQLHLSVNPSGLDYTNWLVLTNIYHVFDYWTVDFTLIPRVVDATSYGMGFGIRGTQKYGGGNLYTLFHTWTDNKGKLDWETGDTNVAFTILVEELGQMPTINADDSIHVTCRRAKNVYTFYATNTTSGGFTLATISTGTASPATNGVSTAGYFAFQMLGQSNSIDDLTIKILRPVTIDWLLFGDSITSGYGSLGQPYAWADMVENKLAGSFYRMGSSGMVTEDACRIMPTITNIVKPRNLVCSFGGNDNYFGTPAAQRNSNYIWFSTNIAYAGINQINCLPSARTNMYSWAVFLQTNRPTTSLVDFWNATRNFNYGSELSMRLDYDSGDTIHPNTAGHAAMAEVFVDYALQWPTNYPNR